MAPAGAEWMARPCGPHIVTPRLSRAVVLPGTALSRPRLLSRSLACRGVADDEVVELALRHCEHRSDRLGLHPHVVGKEQHVGAQVGQPKGKPVAPWETVEGFGPVHVLDDKSVVEPAQECRVPVFGCSGTCFVGDDYLVRARSPASSSLLVVTPSLAYARWRWPSPCGPR